MKTKRERDERCRLRLEATKNATKNEATTIDSVGGSYLTKISDDGEVLLLHIEMDGSIHCWCDEMKDLTRSEIIADDQWWAPADYETQYDNKAIEDLNKEFNTTFVKDVHFIHD